MPKDETDKTPETPCHLASASRDTRIQEPVRDGSALAFETGIPDVTDGRPPARDGRQHGLLLAVSVLDQHVDCSLGGVTIGESRPVLPIDLTSSEALRQLRPAIKKKARGLLGHEATDAVKPEGMRLQVVCPIKRSGRSPRTDQGAALIASNGANGAARSTRHNGAQRSMIIASLLSISRSTQSTRKPYLAFGAGFQKQLRAKYLQ